MQNQFLPSETSVEVTPYILPVEALTPTDVMQTEGVEATASTQTVAALLAQAQGKIRCRRQRNFTAFVACESLIVLSLPLIRAIGAAPDDKAVAMRFTAFLLLLAVAVTPILWMMWRTVDIDLETMAESGNVNAIPTLIDAITLNASQKYRKRVTRALAALLPRLKASDANLLTSRHRYTLNIMLGSCFQPHLRGVDNDFTLAILKAYEQVGDAKAIPVVERIANHRPRNDNQRRIQEAAAECLPLLRANIGEVASTQTLLRASIHKTNTPDTLLRPATASSSTSPAELLRIASNEDTPLT